MIEVVALTFDYLGKMFLIIAVILVHLRLNKERKIDGAVIKALRKEKTFTILGIIFLSAGYFLHVVNA